MTDTIGRSWQLGTVQLDYYMPERFELTYTGADNAEHRPVMIHRALMGSFERFIGILIEHYAGEFPLWLAPVQAIALPIADRHIDAARDGRAHAARGRAARRGRRPHGVGRAQDPRRRAAQDPVHARRRRPRGRGGHGGACAATARATRAASRWPTSSRGSCEDVRERAVSARGQFGDWRRRLGAAARRPTSPAGCACTKRDRSRRAPSRARRAGRRCRADRALRLRARAVHTFTMRFALDLIWLDAEGRVVRVDRGRPAAPPPGVRPGALPSSRRVRAAQIASSARASAAILRVVDRFVRHTAAHFLTRGAHS